MRETFTLRKSLRQIFSREFFSLRWGDHNCSLRSAWAGRCECASSRRLSVLPLAEFFHADFVSLASEHAPIDIPEPSRMAGAPAMLPQRDLVALFQFHFQFAAVALVTVVLNGPAPD